MPDTRFFVSFVRQLLPKLFIGTLLSAAALVWFAPAAHAETSRDCSNAALITCGVLTKDEFVQKYNQNAPGDLKTIYNHYGLSENELDRFQQNAKIGTLYKDGRLVVDGITVAMADRTLGRQQFSDTTPLNIGGKTYHLESISTLLHFYGVESVPVYVLVHNDQIEFVAMSTCGNTITYTQPKYSCDMLESKKINDTTYQFSAKVTAQDGATLTKVTYDFGDGETLEKTNPSEVVTHTYAKPGTYKARVTASFTYANQTRNVTSNTCVREIEIPQPPKPTYECTALTVRKISRTRYEFTATSKVSGGATLKDGDFSFGDTQTQNVKPIDTNKIVIEHEYAKEGDYTTVATLNFNLSSGIAAATCSVKTTVDKLPPKECKPGIPEGDARCQEIPSTGPTEVIGSALGMGSIVAAGGYYVRTRRDLFDTIFKR